MNRQCSLRSGGDEEQLPLQHTQTMGRRGPRRLGFRRSPGSGKLRRPGSLGESPSTGRRPLRRPGSSGESPSTGRQALSPSVQPLRAPVPPRGVHLGRRQASLHASPGRGRSSLRLMSTDTGLGGAAARSLEDMRNLIPSSTYSGEMLAAAVPSAMRLRPARGPRRPGSPVRPRGSPRGSPLSPTDDAGSPSAFGRAVDRLNAGSPGAKGGRGLMHKGHTGRGRHRTEPPQDTQDGSSLRVMSANFGPAAAARSLEDMRHLLPSSTYSDGVLAAAVPSAVRPRRARPGSPVRPRGSPRGSPLSPVEAGLPSAFGGRGMLHKAATGSSGAHPRTAGRCHSNAPQPPRRTRLKDDGGDDPGGFLSTPASESPSTRQCLPRSASNKSPRGRGHPRGTASLSRGGEMNLLTSPQDQPLTTRNEEQPAEDPVPETSITAQFKAIFESLDMNSDGGVSRSELKAKMSKNPRGQKALCMLEIADTDGNDTLTWEEFISFVESTVVKEGFSMEQLGQQQVNVFKSMFTSK